MIISVIGKGPRSGRTGDMADHRLGKLQIKLVCSIGSTNGKCILWKVMKNDIIFPAGILQFPFFDFDADDASNYVVPSVAQ